MPFCVRFLASFLAWNLVRVNRMRRPSPEFVLVAARGFEHVVGHQVGFGGGRIDLVHLGIVQEGVHHFIHAVIERGGEQHVLGVGRNLLKQSLDRWQEAHIGHFVGLLDTRARA